MNATLDKPPARTLGTSIRARVDEVLDEKAAEEKALAMVGEPLNAARATMEHWVEVVRPYMLRGNAVMIELGIKLNQAKKALSEHGHGHWSLFCDRLKQEFGGQRRIQRVMQIANNSALSDASHWTHLPKSARALVELSQAKPAVITRAIRKKQITPDMTIDGAKEFVSDPAGFKPDKAKEIVFSDALASVDLGRAITKQFERFWGQDHKEDFVNRLNSIARDWQDELASMRKGQTADAPNSD